MSELEALELLEEWMSIDQTQPRSWNIHHSHAYFVTLLANGQKSSYAGKADNLAEATSLAIAEAVEIEVQS